MRVRSIVAVLTLAMFAVGVPSAYAQYFGRNKVQYRTFDFQVLKTDHFDIYYYREEADAARVIGRMAERWQSRLSRFFDHDLRGRQAVILYASAADFRQTNAVEGVIGEGTGGVTEALKRRVVVPMAGSLADTDHVLGHELVHAFQFDITGVDPRLGQTGGILGYPLWFVEGMAEYLSLGPIDPQTAMWIRDAVINEDLPSIRDLDNPKYFPYRWGHAFWAYVGARFGDRAIASLLRSAANPRFDWTGLALQLGTDPESLNNGWHQAMREAAATASGVDESSLSSVPRRLIDEEAGGGRINIGPRVSPDGKTIAFFSERDLFSIDLYLADAESGHIERRLIHTATDPHFDSLEFLSSAGAWSPDGRTIALAVARGGKPAFALVEAKTGRILREIPLPGLEDAINPAWSPDGSILVFAGTKGGFTDLFRLTLGTGAIDALTSDPFADLEPTFTPDGRSIVFVTERFSTNLSTLAAGPLRLARLDLATRDVEPIPGFLRGKHISPQVSADGKTVIFIAEPDGVSNLYRMALDGGPIERLSAVSTGIAGITATSPAFSLSTSTGRMAFSVFEKDGDTIYVLDADQIVATVAPMPSLSAAVLASPSTRSVNGLAVPMFSSTGSMSSLTPSSAAPPSGVVYGLLNDAARGLPSSESQPASAPYKGKLSLDMVGQPSVSAGVSSWGPQFGGSMSALFSDMLGERDLGLGASVNGSFDDLGAVAQYLNRRHRWNWGVELDQTPYRVDLLTVTADPDTNLYTEALQIYRQVSRGGGAVAILPINGAQRIEVQSGVHRLSFSREDRTADFAYATGALLDRTDTKTQTYRPLTLAESSVALVGDTSYFGATSPLFGTRYRLELDQTMGTLQYTGLLADVRQYYMPRRPMTLGLRVLHYGRYGRDAEDPVLLPGFIGYPELVRGYGAGSFSGHECAAASLGTCTAITQMLGSRLLVANAEVRAPLFGLFRRDINYGPLPIEVGAFYDVGVAWNSTTRPTFAGGTAPLIRSAGGVIRINAFNIFVVEVSAAHPFDRLDRSLRWQIGIREGF